MVPVSAQTWFRGAEVLLLTGIVALVLVVHGIVPASLLALIFVTLLVRGTQR